MCGANIILNFGWSIMCLGYLQSMVIIHKNNLWFNPHISWQVEKRIRTCVLFVSLFVVNGHENNITLHGR